jgi:hypothetical protein
MSAKAAEKVKSRLHCKSSKNILDKANAMEPDYAELAKEKPISQYQDSRIQTQLISLCEFVDQLTTPC